MRFDVVDFVARVLDAVVFFGADEAFEPFDEEVVAFVLVEDFAPEDFEPEDFAPVDVEPEDFGLADFVPDALDDVPFDDFAEVGRRVAVVELFADRLPLERRVDPFLSSPIGSALPTAFTAPPATPPTVPATFPAVRPTFFTTLPGSGMG